MTRRSKRYTLDLSKDLDFELSTAEWNELLSGGWIVEAGFKKARLKRGVVGWIRGGNLHLLALARVQTVTAGWVRAWLYKVGAISGEQAVLSLSDRQERVLLAAEREAENEALLWRTFRNTRGANEFTWMPPEHKAEILQALRPAWEAA